MFLIPHWMIFMMTVFKSSSENFNICVNLFLAPIDFFLIQVEVSCVFVCHMTFYWEVDILCIILWSSESYLTLLC